jgi:FecR-like protein
MRRWRKPVLAWLALAACLLPAPAFAQATKAGTVTTLEGNVTAVRPIVAQPVSLKFKDDVFLQDRVVTGEQSFARLLLGGKAVVSIRERSAVTITEVPGRSTIEIESGKIALSVARDRMLPGEIINIKTPNVVAGVRGTVVVAEVTRRAGQPFTNLWVIQGIIDTVHTNLQGAPLSPAVTLKAQESLSANPTTSSKGTFTPEQVGTIVRGLQPQRTQEGGSASQSPARLEAVNTAAALLGVLTGTAAGQEEIALLTAPPAPATTTPPDLGPKVNVTMVGNFPPALTVTKPSATVTISAPTAGPPPYTVSSSPLTLGGTLLDNFGVTEVTWINSRGGSGTASGTIAWTASGIVLQIGSNVLTVTARDAAGNTVATAIVTVTLSDTTPPPVADVPDVIVTEEFLVGRTLKTFTGISTRLGLSPLISITDSIVDGSEATLVIVEPGADATLQAGPLMKVTNSTLDMLRLLLVQGNLTSLGTSPLIGLDPATVNAQTLIEITAGGKLSLAGPLLTDLNGRLTARQDAISVAGTLTGTGTGALVALQGTSLTVGTSASQRSAFVAVVGGPNGDTQASLKLSGSLLEGSNGAVVDVRGVNGNVVRLDAALIEATAPLIVLMGDATQLQTSGNAIDLANNASLTTTSADALIKIENQARMAVLNGHLVNVSASRLNVAGDLVRMGSNALLNVNGVLLAVLNGGVVNINGALVRFTGTNATINVVNNILPTLFIGGILPVSIALGANVTIGAGALTGLNGNTIRINGTPLLPGALGITGSLISVGANGTVRIGGGLN